MKVNLELDKVDIPLGNAGLLLKIYDTSGSHVGDLRIGRATVEWMKGRTREGNGRKVPLKSLIGFLDGEDEPKVVRKRTPRAKPPGASSAAA